MIRQQLMKLWTSGELLRATCSCSEVFPLRVRPFKKPTSSELGPRLADVRRWAQALAAEPRIRIEHRSVKHAVIGNNQVPDRVYVDTVEHALALIGKGTEAKLFADLRQQLADFLPQALPWITKYPLRAIELAGEWQRLIHVTQWLSEHPHSGRYLRQLPIAGLHSKWLEQHRSTLAQWLGLIRDEDPPRASELESWLGLRTKPILVRFRLLDHGLSFFADNGSQAEYTLTAEDFSRLGESNTIKAISTVIFTENEINFLSLPAIDGTLAIFACGYGAQGLATAPWLRTRNCWYWGDIDTNGFAILNQFRSALPGLRSILMDEATLLSHKDQWTTEDKPANRSLSFLTASEQQVYEGLCCNTWGDRVRLEQERLSFEVVRSILEGLPFRK
jgi:hypothetical protein